MEGKNYKQNNLISRAAVVVVLFINERKEGTTTSKRDV
jgi:hypothetical protein